MNAKEQIEQAAKELGLTMAAQFVPWSKSRNAGEKQPSLNWEVTISRNGRELLTTDYMAGCGHCPAYKASVRVLGGANSLLREQALKLECENGQPVIVSVSSGHMHVNRSAEPILPELADVLHSLASDAGVLDYSTFEDWASEFGYDGDSRKAEGIYRACLEIALKLRNGIGEDGLAKLREAGQDY